jgi:MFS family permease
MGQTISAFGSMVGGPAMTFTAILVLRATPFQLGILAAARLVPGLLTSLFAGAWVDRLRRRPILIAADIGRAVALLSIPAVAYLRVLRIEQLYAVAFLVSIFSIFFDVAYQSYLPSLVTKEELIEGNSKLTASSAISEFAGFGIAGWLVQIFTPPIAILIDSVSFIASAVFVGRIGTQEPHFEIDEQRDMGAEIMDGLRVVASNPILRDMGLSYLTFSLFLGVAGPLVVLYMSRVLGFSPGVLGMIWALGGISSFFGAVFAGRVANRIGAGRAMIFGMLFFGISMLFIPLARGATIFSASLLIAQQLSGDGAATIYEITQVSLRQAISPQRLLGRVNASMKFVGLGATLVGSMVGGILGERIGVRATLAAAAFGALFSVLWLVFSPLRNLRVECDHILEPEEAK